MRYMMLRIFPKDIQDLLHFPPNESWPAAGVRYRVDGIGIDEDKDLADELLIGFEDGVTMASLDS